MSPSLDARLQALARAVELADGRLDAAAVRAAASVVRRAGERLGHGLDATVVALAGPTGAGKSTLFNLLAGQELATVGVRRPTTSVTTAAIGRAADPGLLDWLGVQKRHALDGAAPDGLVLLDLPDFDSVEASHRLEVDRLVQLVDLLVWVVDPQKYADAALHDRYLRPLADYAATMLVALNKVDTLAKPARAAAAKDLRRLLEYEGLSGVPVVAVSGQSGEGMEALRAAIAERVRTRATTLARLSADVTVTARQLRLAIGDGSAAGAGRRQRDVLVASLAEAAGVAAIVRAVERAHRHRGALACGMPWLSWLRRLRPDPLRRLGLGGTPSEEVRTSMPPATAAQRAQVDSAIRLVANEAAGGLTEPWPTLARRAATASETELADQLDRAVSGADLRMAPPRWWSAARWAQRLVAAAAAAGALWLAALAALGFLQLADAVPTPHFGDVPAPTALLVGGLAAGALLAMFARWLNRLGASRRARRARRALYDRIGTVAEELVLNPLRAELAARDALSDALDAAMEGRHGSRPRLPTAPRTRPAEPVVSRS